MRYRLHPKVLKNAREVSVATQTRQCKVLRVNKVRRNTGWVNEPTVIYPQLTVRLQGTRGEDLRPTDVSLDKVTLWAFLPPEYNGQLIDVNHMDQLEMLDNPGEVYEVEQSMSVGLSEGRIEMKVLVTQRQVG